MISKKASEELERNVISYSYHASDDETLCLWDADVVGSQIVLEIVFN